MTTAGWLALGRNMGNTERQALVAVLQGKRIWLRLKMFELECGSVKFPVASPVNGAMGTKRKKKTLRTKVKKSPRTEELSKYTLKSVPNRLALQAIAQIKSLSSLYKNLCNYRRSS